MAALNSSASADTQYLTQLRGQAEGALSKTEQRACSLVAQVLQAHALLGATVGLPLKTSQQQQLVSSIGKIEKQVRVCACVCVLARKLGDIHLVMCRIFCQMNDSSLPHLTPSTPAPTTQVTALKGEVSVMLQDIVVAEAAIVSLKLAVESAEEDPTSASLTTSTPATKEPTHSAVSSLVQLLGGESPSVGPSSDDQWDDSFNVEEMDAASKDDSAVETAVPSG